MVTYGTIITQIIFLYSDEDINWEKDYQKVLKEMEQGIISADNKVNSETTEIKSGGTAGRDKQG